MREAEELEKLQRGEIIKQSSNVQAKRTPRKNVREKKRKPRKQRAREVANDYVPTDEVYRGLRPFRGTSKLQRRLLRATQTFRNSPYFSVYKTINKTITVSRTY